MKLSSALDFGKLVDERQLLEHQLAGLEEADLTVVMGIRSRTPSTLGWVESRYTDRAMAEALRPALAIELGRRLANNTASLTALGVEVDAIPPSMLGPPLIGTGR